MKTPKAIKRAERMLGKQNTERLVDAADETLVRIGQAARARQRRRTAKRVLSKAAVVSAVVGAGAAAAVIAKKALGQ